MSKYASLPDLDTAPDVYETPDIAENYEPEPLASPNEDIDTSSTDAASASQRFASVDFDNSRTFYSSRIDRSNASFSTGTAGESRESKLARIKLELQELTESADNSEDVDALKDMLDKLTMTKKERMPILEVSAGSLEHKPAPTPAAKPLDSYSDEWKKLTSLERRISVIETSIYDTTGPEGPPIPLGSAIRDLMLKLSLLTSSPQALQAQQQRIQSLGVRKRNMESRMESRGESRMESRAESRMESRVAPSESGDHLPDNTAIVYSHLPTITYLSHVVPKLLMRLKTLRQVHKMASQSVETAATVSAMIHQLEDAVKQWSIVLNRLEQLILESGDKMNSNIEHLKEITSKST